MELTKELLEKAKTAKSAEELQNMAKADNIELSADEAAKAFAELHKTGELADDELDNVSGGCYGNPSPKGEVDSEKQVVFLYEIGQQVEVIETFGCTVTSVITGRSVGKILLGGYFPCYKIVHKGETTEYEVGQNQIQIP